MRKTGFVALLCALLALALLAGCVPGGGGAGASRAGGGAAASGAISSAPGVSSSSAGSVSAANSAPLPYSHSFDPAHFEAYLKAAGYGIFMGEPVSSPLVMEDWYFTPEGVITWTLEWYYDQHGLEKQVIAGSDAYAFPISELEQVSREIFGFTYNFGRDEPDTRVPKGYYAKIWGFGPTYGGEVRPGSIHNSLEGVNVVMDFESQTLAKWSNTFTFEYHPEYQYCPYKLVKSELVPGSETPQFVEPDVRMDGSVKWETLDELNLRAGPGTEYDPPLTVLPKGTVLEQYGYMSNGPEKWICVSHGMALGWVDSTYCKRL